MRFLAICALLACALPNLRALTVSDLKCEHRSNPLGIDASQPRLSWVLNSRQRGDGQTAYQIIVDGLWDTGRVESDQSVNVEYAGAPLVSGARCQWKVRVWDKEGRPSGWSKPAWWQMGLLSEQDWGAKWIGATNAPSTPENSKQKIAGASRKDSPGFAAVMLRKEVAAPKKIRRATAYVCGLGLYELGLNGRRVSDHLLEPPYSDYTKRIIYQAYDLTGQWREGANAIAVLLGNGWYHLATEDLFGNGHAPWRGAPKLRLRIELEFADGERQAIVSDETWKWSVGPITFNCIRGGEDYDARLEQPGWDTAKFDDAGWHPAIEVSAPKGKLVCSQLFPARLTETMPSVNIKSNGPGVWEIDFGRNLAGWARLRARGAAGQKIEMDFPAAPSHTYGRYQKDTYILKGGGEEVYEPRFTHHGFRKVILRGLSNAPGPETLMACNVHSDLPEAGSFACSDARLNQIQAVLRRTCENYNLHFPADPTREKAGWIQDVETAFPTQMLNFDSEAMYRKWLDDMRDAQVASGYEPPIAPNPGIWYDGNWNGPWWGGMIVYLPWQLYQFSGDQSILAENYGAMKGFVNWMRTIEGRTDNWCPQQQPLGANIDLTKTPLDGLTIWGLGDWGEVGTTGYPKRTPVALTATCGGAYFNRLVSQAAALLNKTADAEFYARESVRITAALNRTYLDPATGWYAKNSQTAQLLPLCLDLAPADKRAQIADRLADSIAAAKNHISTGFEGTPLLLTGLTEMGLGNLAWTVATQPDEPGWLDIVARRKSSTLMEFWNAGGVQMPSCQGAIGEWFIRDLGGIRLDPASPGFKHILIRPAPLGDLTYVRSAYATPYGKVTSHWQRKEGRFEMDVTIPVNTTATICVPGADAADVLESGKPAERTDGVKFLKVDGEYACYEVSSGRYHFVAKARKER